MKLLDLLLIALGGGIGSLLRYILLVLFPINQSGFPTATFLANLVASFVLGCIVGFVSIQTKEISWLKPFLIIGLCGGFSTFSTFAFELFRFGNQQQYIILILYTLVSILGAIACIYLGFVSIKTLII